MFIQLECCKLTQRKREGTKRKIKGRREKGTVTIKSTQSKTI